MFSYNPMINQNHKLENLRLEESNNNTCREKRAINHKKHKARVKH